MRALRLFYFDFRSARITDSKSCQIIESVLKYKNGFKNNLMYKEIILVYFKHLFIFKFQVFINKKNQSNIVGQLTKQCVLFKEIFTNICNGIKMVFSIFNSGHVGWCTASPDTILKLDTLVMIQTKFGFHWSSTFRGEDF
jgi:hypothetical protein